MRDGSPKGRDAGSVYDSPSPKGHGLTPVAGTEAKIILRGFFDGNDRL